jgi:hypothetical protein
MGSFIICKSYEKFLSLVTNRKYLNTHYVLESNIGIITIKAFKK